MKVLDITGEKFGRLTAVAYVGRDKWNKPMWKCICDCGKSVVCLSNNLRRGNTKSCGCLSVEKTIERSTKHGERNSRLYNIWSLMKNRCSDKRLKNYAGRGITVCEEWKSSFDAFYQWAINNGYSDGLTIDRINNDGNYEPENCRWVTNKDQARNRRTNHYVSYKGKKYLITDLEKQLNISRHAIARRMARGKEIKV